MTRNNIKINTIQTSKEQKKERKKKEKKFREREPTKIDTSETKEKEGGTPILRQEKTNQKKDIKGIKKETPLIIKELREENRS
jgi:hypothetical protein